MTAPPGAQAPQQNPTTETQPLPVVDGQAPMISVRNVTKKMGDRAIVHDLNFEVKQGEIFGFIGPSGSGKTTTIRLLLGIFAPTEGQITVMGESPTHPSRTVHERFGYMPQLFVLYPNLSVEENLEFAASLYALNIFNRGKRIRKMLEFVELWESRHSLAGKVSGGQQRRIQLAASLLHNPPLLFADEPTAGIDPVLRGKFWDEFRRLRDEGRTLFVTTQYVGESEYCDRVAVIRRGHIVAVDTPLQLRRLALGGEVVDIESSNLSRTALTNLSRLPFVKRIVPTSINTARVFVEDAGEAIPHLLDTLQTDNCEVGRIEEYRPSFDEVFIELMKQDAEQRGESNSSDEAGA